MTGATLFQASDVTSIYNERLAIVFGFITLALGLSVFLSCRVCISWLSHLGLQNPTKIRGYSSFYKYHLYYWWAFGVMLIAHIMVSILHTGFPQTSDPDASIHWIILGLGLGSFVTALGVFSSCRVLPKLMAMVTPKNPFSNTLYKPFFKYHSYYWLIMTLLVLAHFTVSGNHTGIWPGG